MIKVNNGVASFLSTSAETQTPIKVAELTVIYSNVLTYEENLPVGIIQSYLLDGSGVSIFPQKNQPNADFVGKDILFQLTEEYITKLQLLNPKVKFVNTLIP